MAILDFWISSNFQESAVIKREVIRTNKGTKMWAKNKKVKERKVFFFILDSDFPVDGLSKFGCPCNTKVNER